MQVNLWLIATAYLINASLGAQVNPVLTSETIPRKVLILDFVNQANDKGSDYLSVSVAEALLDPLKKTGKFYLLPRNSASAGVGLPVLSVAEGNLPPEGSKPNVAIRQAEADTAKPAKENVPLSPSKGDGPLQAAGPTVDEATAIARGKAAGADVVVIGNFVSVGGQVQIQSKALDVHTGQIAVGKTTYGKLDATVFDLIQKLADDMSTAMAAALPPIPKQVVLTERVGFGLYAKDFHAHLFAGTGLPLGKPNPYLAPGIGGMADLKFEFLHRFINPYFSFALTQSAGKKSVENMMIFTALGGAGYTFPIKMKFAFVRSLAVTPSFAMGSSFGTIRATPDLETQSFSYNVFTLSTGATLDAAITERWSAALTIRGNYLIESQTPLPVIFIMLGAGYRL